jgi:hypothetical protein
VAGAGEEIAGPHVALGVGGVGLVQHAHLAAAVPLDAQGRPRQLRIT